MSIFSLIFIFFKVQNRIPQRNCNYNLRLHPDLSNSNCTPRLSWSGVGGAGWRGGGRVGWGVCVGGWGWGKHSFCQLLRLSLYKEMREMASTINYRSVDFQISIMLFFLIVNGGQMCRRLKTSILEEKFAFISYTTLQKPNFILLAGSGVCLGNITLYVYWKKKITITYC